MRRARSTSVLVTLLAGAAGVISSTQTWVHVVLTGGATSDVAVAGATAIPVLAPLSLAVLALGAALSIVGRALRLVFGLLTVLIAVLLATLVVPLLVGVPASAITPSVTEVTGIAGDSAVGDLVSSTSTTAWPFVAALAALVLAAVGVFVVVTGMRWPSGTRKYEAAARRDARRTTDGPLDAVDSWDDLSRGDDPTTLQTPR
ncbi:Trp biosynthesis-associated membrane protein [Microbacterium sp. cx-55]|uniref:Trp biosynthesis-associated membrane protein n=1 Tax=Microbacterium sp. cx-55 TaxID=2875948 RepID=UPI001CC0DC2B|nr:Trp biosynthesis-associated membrane protein [Microbacterium sp. cx-55]MBZ4486414.1 Trp biosynthesis-associated membrane protein [Microbacterium sp. cx-55]UGB36613.1 Trp biosynthesis-associated membrane protein [Microbacterium sp. cx-55]